MKKKTKKNTLYVPKELQQALDDFPRLVAQKKRRYLARQKFLKKTFGPLIKEIEKIKKSS